MTTIVTTTPARVYQPTTGVTLWIGLAADRSDALRQTHIAAGYPDGIAPDETGDDSTLRVEWLSAPASLDDLRDLLVLLDGQYDAGACTALGIPLRHGQLAADDLPTFGGEPVEGDPEVVSWDADRVLAYTGTWEITDRGEF